MTVWKHDRSEAAQITSFSLRLCWVVQVPPPHAPVPTAPPSRRRRCCWLAQPGGRSAWSLGEIRQLRRNYDAIKGVA